MDDGSPPYAAYGAIASTFAGGLFATAMIGQRLHRSPREHSSLDLVILGLATFKAARTLAGDPVTSFIREPFVEGTPAATEEETPVRTGDIRQAVGELVTCSRCIGTWVAGGLAATEILAPRFGRLATWTFAVAGLNDWAQAGFALITGAANERGG